MLDSIRIAHINFSDLAGGAEEFARELSGLQKHSILLVKEKKSSCHWVQEISTSRLSKLIRLLDRVIWKAGIKTSIRNALGRQDEFHDTVRILEQIDEYKKADIVHFHNLHGEYFDFAAVKHVSLEKRVIWTLHDEWFMTGGEGYIVHGVSRSERSASYPMKPGNLIDRRKAVKAKKKATLTDLRDHITLVTPSKTHLRQVRSYFGHEDIEYINCGINIDLFNNNHCFKSGTAQVLIYSTTSIYKDSNRVNRALEQCKSTFDLHVLGQPIKMNSASINVHNHGQIAERKKLAELFNTIDIAVFASR
jgi:glycosyltransferase involved in cell wall biosynthesis